MSGTHRHLEVEAHVWAPGVQDGFKIGIRLSNRHENAPVIPDNEAAAQREDVTLCRQPLNDWHERVQDLRAVHGASLVAKAPATEREPRSAVRSPARRGTRAQNRRLGAPARHPFEVPGYLEVHIDAADARTLVRLLTAEFDRLVAEGRDARTDREVMQVGTLLRTVSEWLGEQDQPDGQ